jgi:catechol 2,3-dioxygenase-like lactoylglutathione lyase family enzyme
LPIRFNHTIVFARDKQRSADFLAELLALPEPQEAGALLAVTLDDGVTLDYAEPGIDFNSQHIAFLVTEEDFDGIFDRLRASGVRYWADPRKAHPGEINRNDDGRGVYFDDPGGHHFEVITRPYSCGS